MNRSSTVCTDTDDKNGFATRSSLMCTATIEGRGGRGFGSRRVASKRTKSKQHILVFTKKYEFVVTPCDLPTRNKQYCATCLYTLYRSTTRTIARVEVIFPSGNGSHDFWKIHYCMLVRH